MALVRCLNPKVNNREPRVGGQHGSGNKTPGHHQWVVISLRGDHHPVERIFHGARTAKGLDQEARHFSRWWVYGILRSPD